MHKAHNIHDRCTRIRPTALVVVFTNLLRHLTATCYAHRCTGNFCPRGIASSLDDSIRVVPLLLTLCSAEENLKAHSSRHLTRNVIRQVVVIIVVAVVVRERHVAAVIMNPHTSRKVPRHLGLRLISASLNRWLRDAVVHAREENVKRLLHLRVHLILWKCISSILYGPRKLIFYLLYM